MSDDSKMDEKKDDINTPKPSLNLLKDLNKKRKLKKVKKKTTDSQVISEPKYKSKLDNNKKKRIILIIDFQTNWYNQFKNAALSDGTPLQIEQTLWTDIDVQASSSKDNALMVHINASSYPIPGTNQHKNRCIKPDFICIRNFPTDIHDNSFKNLLYGFMFSNIPSINNLKSIFFGMHRPLVYAELNKLGLPMVPMVYHPNFTANINNNEFDNNNNINYPKVIKVASTHSGYGKIRVKNNDEMNDVKSILILSKDYYTEETLIENIDFEYRIQKIGTHYRCFKRISSNSWKNNWGNIAFIDYKCNKKHIEWINKAATIFGGLDICALDVLKLNNNNEIILELNGTACGLMKTHELEDASYIRDLIVDKMSKIYCN